MSHLYFIATLSFVLQTTVTTMSLLQIWFERTVDGGHLQTMPLGGKRADRYYKRHKDLSQTFYTLYNLWGLNLMFVFVNRYRKIFVFYTLPAFIMYFWGLLCIRHIKVLRLKNRMRSSVISYFNASRLWFVSYVIEPKVSKAATPNWPHDTDLI